MKTVQARARWVGEVLPHEGEVAVRSLLDPEAVMRPDPGAGGIEVSEGDVVIVKRGDGEGLVVGIERLLAASGSPAADLYRVAGRHGLDPLYPEEVLEEAASLAASPGLDDPSLRDLEDLPFVTIDNEDSRDLDQALFLVREKRSLRVYYALADASHYVRPGSSLFSEALKRGSSYYFPAFALPMLPRPLSEGLISLNSGEARRALVFSMRLDAEGRCRGTEVFRARIRSRSKLSYAGVQRFWDDPWGSPLRGEDFADSLELLREVGVLRMKEAQRRHVVDHHRVELKIRPGVERGWDVQARDRLLVERCNEQISLLCNIEGAKILARGRRFHHVQPIFRNHPQPTPEAVRVFSDLVSALVRAHRLDPARWEWRPEERDLSEYLAQLPRRARPGIAEAIERQAIVMNRRSLFDPRPAGHYGIGAPVYARFSSPMREIVGIFTHKELLELLGDDPPVAPDSQEEILRDEVVDAGNRSKWLQKTLEKDVLHLVLDELFLADAARPREQRPVRRGTVLGMKPHLVYVRLHQPPVEVKIHIKDLVRTTGCGWKATPDTVEIRPDDPARWSPIRVGSSLDLVVTDHDDEARRWLLRPARENPDRVRDAAG